MVVLLVFGWSREDMAQNVFVVRPTFFPFFDKKEESYCYLGDLEEIFVCACWHFQVAGFFSTQPEICELQGKLIVILLFGPQVS